MNNNIIVKRYLIMLGGAGKYILAVGDRAKLDNYIASKFGAVNIASGEELDGSPVIHSDLTNEATESILLNNVVYN